MINDVNIYIKILLDDGYIISKTDDKSIVFTRYSVDGTEKGRFYTKVESIELHLSFELFMVKYTNVALPASNHDYYNGKHIGEIEFISKNIDRIRDIKLGMLCG